MRTRDGLLALILTLSLGATLRGGPDGNRLTDLDEASPYHVGLGFPRLTTPQWVGEEGVEAVVVLAIDDMRGNVASYDTFLRPILDRLAKIDGRAPVSIMTCFVDPTDPALGGLLRKGVNLDVHTLTHPCPLLGGGDFAAAKATVDQCIDLLNRVPANRPVAFRMPCCDSRNTVSPRFFAEIFNARTAGNHFLTIDSSVFNITTPNDPALARGLVLEDGRERFRKYLPFTSFVNTIEDYPYPFVIGRLCWEFPCAVPSDWEAQNLLKPNHPKMVEDMKAGLDAVVARQGVFNLVFHPHGWIRSEQIVELIDHAVKTHGKKVKFLNFREAQERLDANLLGGQPLRVDSGKGPPDRLGTDNGVRLLDLDADGYMDVVIGNETLHQTRRWDPGRTRWATSGFPEDLTRKGVQFGIVRPDGKASMLIRDERHAAAWDFDGETWIEALALLRGLDHGGELIATANQGVDRGVRLRDIDHDGRCELLASNGTRNDVFRWAPERGGWEKLPFALPAGARIVDGRAWNGGLRIETPGADAGLRFLDLDEDGRDDVIVSNDEGSAVALFVSMTEGWARPVSSARRNEGGAIPPFVSRDARSGRFVDRGAWVHSRHIWWQNEDTAGLHDLVDRRAFADLLKDAEPRARSPEASRRSIRVRPGFAVELMASEPLVRDPIAFEWGADGKLWVVEMGDYPLGTDGRGKPGGTVKFLEDKDGDGRYDSSTVFLDGLAFPTGVMPWRKGVIVSCAPTIFYAEDTDGDGAADLRRTLFSGFIPGNPQHRVNGFDFGLDNWIYGANGDSGGVIRSEQTGTSINISGRDFRFRPDDGRFEAETGQAQYGRHRDDWGNWFGNNNSVLAWHYLLDDHDIRRNPTLAPPGLLRVLDADRRLFPISRVTARFNDPGAVGQVTSANSPTPYRDDLFGPAFADDLFVSEPVHNLVRRVVVEADGVSFKGHRAADEADREFLASTDNWTRPTMLKTGPDGALWVADMYRAVIEHPEWIPGEVQQKLDLRAGHDLGRIYRVVPVGVALRPFKRLDTLDTPGLVAAMDSRNGWTRDMVQRLLVHAADRRAIEPLRRLALAATSPRVRVQALWTLEGLEGLTPALIRKGLADPHPEVRRNALRAGEGLWKSDPGLVAAAARLADDPDVRVRLALALAAGATDDPAVVPALVAIARRDGADPTMRAAILSSAMPHAGGLLAGLVGGDGPGEPPTAIVEPLYAMVAATPGSKGLAPLIEAIGTPVEGCFAPWQWSALAGLLDASGGDGKALSRRAEGEPELRGPMDRLDRLVRGARDAVDDDQAAEARRLAAVRVLGRGADGGADLPRLARLLRPQVSNALRAEALVSLGRMKGEPVADALLNGWGEYSPETRGAVLDLLVSRETWMGPLLTAIESKKVLAAEVNGARRGRLLAARAPEVKARAAKLLAAPDSARNDVVNRYRPALDQPGDPKVGALAFKRVCASCHRVGNEGVEVGPALATLADKGPEALLIAILDPNRAFESRYASYSVETKDGRVLTGLVSAETANAVTLRRQEGKEDTILRAEIETMAASGQSLMPEGLEKDLSMRDLADLIAFLMATDPPPKLVAGNRPEVLRPGPDGTITLLAEAAEIYGPNLTLEPRYKNLGFWSASDDRAAWRFEVAKPGRHAVWAEWACDEGFKGNAYVLEVGRSRVEGVVASTGSWDEYRKARLGEVTLGAGPSRLTLRPQGPVQGALMDLRSIVLRPMEEGRGPR